MGILVSMPYEFELGAPEDVFVGIHGDYTVDFDLGVDTDTKQQIVMTIALVEDDDSGGDPFGLIFGIRKKDLDTENIVGPFFDHDAARKYVPKEHSGAVMLQILLGLTLLVQHVNPSMVAMETYETDLPVPAMAKYMRICNHMGLLGYAQTEYRRDGTDRKDYWLFTK